MKGTSLSQDELFPRKRGWLSSFYVMKTALGAVIALAVLTFAALFLPPSGIVAAVTAVLGLGLVIFTWSLQRTTYFSRVNLRTKEFVNMNWWIPKTWGDWAISLYPLLTALFLFIFVFWLFTVRLASQWAQSYSLIYPILIYFLFFSLVYSVWVWQIMRVRQIYDEYCPTLAGLIANNYSNNNQIRLPIVCHKGDSHNICLILKPATDHKSDFWEAELQAAGVKVSGELTQQEGHTITSGDRIVFFWNCNFNTPGKHLVNLLVRTTTEGSDVKKDVLLKSHEIRVVTLYRQYATTLLTAIAAVLTFLLALMSSMHIDMTSVLQSLHF
jgi:hypothetical protein